MKETRKGKRKIMRAVREFQTINHLSIEPVRLNTYVGKEHGFWCEDCAIQPQTKLSLGQAIDALWKTDCIKPQSSKVTLRKPLGPKILDSSYFIFGNQSSGLQFVNSTSGEVTESIFD